MIKRILMLATVSTIALAAPLALADETPQAPAAGSVRLVIGPRHATIIRDEISLQEKRANELDRSGHWDLDKAAEMETHARARDDSAARFDNRAREYRSIAGELDGRLRDALIKFAVEMETYARHDREFAAERRRIAHALSVQGNDAIAAAAGHRDHVARLRAFLADNGA